MQRYRDYRPTQFDIKGLGARKHRIGYWYVFPIILTRDADILTQSNFEVISKDLGADKTPGVAIHSFNHWGCGTFDLILINPWNKSALEKAEDWARQLSNYPVADDHHFSQMEFEAQGEYLASTELNDLSRELENQFPIDCMEVSQEDMWKFFDYLQEKHHTDWDSDCCIYMAKVAQQATFNECLLNLPGIKIDTTSYDYEPLSDKQWHEFVYFGVKLFDTEGDEITPPDYIVIWHDKRQARLFPDNAIVSK
jgi:hypothetical protein